MEPKNNTPTPSVLFGGCWGNAKIIGSLFVFGQKFVRILEIVIQIRTSHVLNDGTKKNTPTPSVLFGRHWGNVQMFGSKFVLGREVVQISEKVIQIRTNLVLNYGTKKNIPTLSVLVGGAGETFLLHCPNFLFVG